MLPFRRFDLLDMNIMVLLDFLLEVVLQKTQELVYIKMGRSRNSYGKVQRVTDCIFGEVVVSLLDQVLDVDNPVLETWPSHLKQSAGSGVVVGLAVGAGQL